MLQHAMGVEGIDRSRVLEVELDARSVAHRDHRSFIARASSREIPNLRVRWSRRSPSARRGAFRIELETPPDDLDLVFGKASGFRELAGADVTEGQAMSERFRLSPGSRLEPLAPAMGMRA